MVRKFNSQGGAVAIYIANNGKANDATSVTAIRNAIVNLDNGYVVAQNSTNGFTGDKDIYPEPMLFLPTPSPTPTSTPDTSSLIISNITVSAITTTTATISWFTNKPSTSRVSFGNKSTNLNQTTNEDTTLTMNHSVILTNLARNTRYYFKVHSKNSAGLETSSSTQQFRTKNR